MRDSLKEHIENSREDFELYPFEGDNEWKNIANKIQPSDKQRNPWKIVGIAACFACVLMGSVFFANTSSSQPNELVEMENFYNSEINHKINLIKNQLNDDRILKDVEEMDVAFAELKADLNDNVDNEEVITAMMENYQLKLQILEEILSEIEKEKSEEML
ncbi:hypothetical protein [Ekhidna sp.]|uniref:hypothetical protein n=1 Tax=Ekhidna sp. TaxID=2608089 RepID=UPI003B511989